MARPAHRGASWYRNVLLTGISGLLCAGAGVAVVASHVHGTAGIVASTGPSGRAVIRPPAPLISATSTGARTVRAVAAGRLGKLPWPKFGEGAIAVQGVGLIAESRRQPVVPIASVTKVMTAYVVLHDHPLRPGAGGPVLEMTDADHLAYLADVAANDSSIKVADGEKLDERQMLEALLIPSADNIADLLARWDAGSVRAFVGKMNADARALGMSSTHYADPSGLDPGDRSTAADQARLGGVAMAIPTLASIVDLGHVRLPVAGEVWGYNPALGEDGVVGVKSGFTSHSLGCLTVAAVRTVAGHRTLLIAVALGQPWGLGQAADADKALLNAATPKLGLLHLVQTNAAVATVDVPWTTHRVAVYAPSRVDLVTWPGLAYSVAVRTEFGRSPWHLVRLRPSPHTGGNSHGRPPPSVGGGLLPTATQWLIPAGTDVGSIDVFAATTHIATIPLRLAHPIAGPPAGWSASPSRV